MIYINVDSFDTSAFTSFIILFLKWRKSPLCFFRHFSTHNLTRQNIWDHVSTARSVVTLLLDFLYKLHEYYLKQTTIRIEGQRIFKA